MSISEKLKLIEEAEAQNKYMWMYQWKNSPEYAEKKRIQRMKDIESFSVAVFAVGIVILSCILGVIE